MSTNIGDNFEKGTISAIAGESEAENIAADIREKYSGLQIEIVKGGQPHYDYIVSVE